MSFDIKSFSTGTGHKVLEKMVAAVLLNLGGGLRQSKVVACAILTPWGHGNQREAYIGLVRPEFTPVEIVGYEVDEAGSPFVLDNGQFTLE